MTDDDEDEETIGVCPDCWLPVLGGPAVGTAACRCERLEVPA